MAGLNKPKIKKVLSDTGALGTTPSPRTIR